MVCYVLLWKHAVFTYRLVHYKEVYVILVPLYYNIVIYIYSTYQDIMGEQNKPHPLIVAVRKCFGMTFELVHLTKRR